MTDEAPGIVREPILEVINKIDELGDELKKIQLSQ
jgi:hypothetical protein